MKRILMADDDRNFLLVVSRYLAQAGFEVCTAATGQEAVRMARAERPDLLVLDVALPLLSGDQVAEALPELPILFVSGRDLDRLGGLSGDRYRFLRKPADLDEILEQVQALLGA
ncbi:MAG TPA: response regulator [Oscillatoriaceae cyanobacterium]